LTGWQKARQGDRCSKKRLKVFELQMVDREAEEEFGLDTMNLKI
jgi:hypothetical protein